MGRRTLHVGPPTRSLWFPSNILNTVLRRADFADDEYIRELTAWSHPHATSTDEFQYTEKENLVMLRLPRKECTRITHSSRVPNACLTFHHHQISPPLHRHTSYTSPS